MKRLDIFPDIELQLVAKGKTHQLLRIHNRRTEKTKNLGKIENMECIRLLERIAELKAQSHPETAITDQWLNRL